MAVRSIFPIIQVATATANNDIPSAINKVLTGIGSACCAGALDLKPARLRLALQAGGVCATQIRMPVSNAEASEEEQQAPAGAQSIAPKNTSRKVKPGVCGTSGALSSLVASGARPVGRLGSCDYRLLWIRHGILLG